VVICLERGADLHTAQLMPLPLTVSCFSKIQIGFTFLVPAHPGSPRQRAVKRLCVLAVLIYEPDNSEALSFQPLIEQKLTLGGTFHISIIVSSPFLGFHNSDRISSP